jgi:hypothetical protein
MVVVHGLLASMTCVAIDIDYIRCVVSAIGGKEEEIVPSVIHQCVVEALTIRNLVFADIWNPERGKIELQAQKVKVGGRRCLMNRRQCYP